MQGLCFDELLIRRIGGSNRGQRFGSGPPTFQVRAKNQQFLFIRKFSCGKVGYSSAVFKLSAFLLSEVLDPEGIALEANEIPFSVELKQPDRDRVPLASFPALDFNDPDSTRSSKAQLSNEELDERICDVQDRPARTSVRRKLSARIH